jgi:hypothetical protein
VLSCLACTPTNDRKVSETLTREPRNSEGGTPRVGKRQCSSALKTCMEILEGTDTRIRADLRRFCRKRAQNES